MIQGRLARTIEKLKRQFPGKVDDVPVFRMSYLGSTHIHTPFAVLLSLGLFVGFFVLPIEYRKNIRVDLVGVDILTKETVVCAWPKETLKQAGYSAARVRVKPVEKGTICGDDGVRIRFIDDREVVSEKVWRQRAIDAERLRFEEWMSQQECPDVSAADNEDAMIAAWDCRYAAERRYQKENRISLLGPRFGPLIDIGHSFVVRGSIYEWARSVSASPLASRFMFILPLLPFVFIWIDHSVRKHAKRQIELANETEVFGLYLREFKRELIPQYKKYWWIAAGLNPGGIPLSQRDSSFESYVPRFGRAIPWVAIANTSAKGFSAFSLRVVCDDDVWFHVMKDMAQEAAIVALVVHDNTEGMRQEIEWLVSSELFRQCPLVFVLGGKPKNRINTLQSILNLLGEDEQLIATRFSEKKKNTAPLLLALSGNSVFLEGWSRKVSHPSQVDSILGKTESQISKLVSKFHHKNS